jgi:signal transduction histidine kinase
LVIIRDITASRVRERQKDDLVSMAAHELRSPLSTLRGYAQLVEHDASAAGVPRLATAAGKIMRQADRTTALVADLLDVSRIQSGHMELRLADARMLSVILDAVEQQHAVHPDRDIQVEDCYVDEVVHVDAQRLGQVLANLLDNAIKYSAETTPVRVRLFGSLTEIKVTVTDEGIGIPVAEQGHLFQSFYRTKSGVSHRSGLGVGLFISNQVVRQHGGHMWLRSAESRGSEFGFSLPVKHLPE